MLYFKDEQARISHIGISTRKCAAESNRLTEKVCVKRDTELIKNKERACSSADRAPDL